MHNQVYLDWSVLQLQIVDVILTMKNDSFCIERTLQFILTKELQNYSFIPLDESRIPLLLANWFPWKIKIYSSINHFVCHLVPQTNTWTLPPEETLESGTLEIQLSSNYPFIQDSLNLEMLYCIRKFLGKSYGSFVVYKDSDFSSAFPHIPHMCKKKELLAKETLSVDIYQRQFC